MLMLVCGVFPVGTYALPCFAGILLMAIVVEFGTRWALGVYLCVSLLSVLLVSDKEAVLYYILILGIYPILKSFFEKIRHRWLSILFKLLFFNAVAVAAFYISIGLLAVPIESFELFGLNMPLLFLAIGNIVFVLYDLCLTRLVGRYIQLARQLFKF